MNTPLTMCVCPTHLRAYADYAKSVLDAPAGRAPLYFNTFNIFLYVHDESIEALKLPDHPNLFAQKHIVHPECLISKITEIDIDNASVANLIKALLIWIKKMLVI